MNNLLKSDFHFLPWTSIPLSLPDPCPIEKILVEEPEPGNCSLVWDDVYLVEYYIAFIKRDNGTEILCNTTETSCQFFCMCGHTYLTTVVPYNQAGPNPSSHVRNYTTSRTTTQKHPHALSPPTHVFVFKSKLITTGFVFSAHQINLNSWTPFCNIRKSPKSISSCLLSSRFVFMISSPLTWFQRWNTRHVPSSDSTSPKYSLH